MNKQVEKEKKEREKKLGQSRDGLNDSEKAPRSPVTSRPGSANAQIKSARGSTDVDQEVTLTTLKADFSNSICPPIFEGTIPEGSYVHHIDLEELVWSPDSGVSNRGGELVGQLYTTGTWTRSPIILVLTSTHYLIIIKNLNYSIEFCNDLREIQSIDNLLESKIPTLTADEKITGFKINFQEPVAKNKVGSTELGSFIRERLFVADSEEDKEFFLIAFRYLLRRIWQSSFELHYMTVPEVYQIHRFVNKTNANGRNQIRCLAISTERIYNLQAPTLYPLIPGKVKWSFKLSSIKSVNVTDPKKLTINAPLPKNKQQITFKFKDELEKEEVLWEIKRLYFQHTNKELAFDLTPPLRKSSNLLSSFYR